ncbi:hypothetical protein NM688_g6359 [Phlebia brevispora]|uniref:Uncharacterized protein n=1 Tax=Phlebia brevispora TaxID=194682 RepID=A0ACC1SGP8_9APHY|nr:hypothetical protein NM688_g6359 [Phlebia brevispora]
MFASMVSVGLADLSVLLTDKMYHSLPVGSANDSAAVTADIGVPNAISHLPTGDIHPLPDNTCIIYGVSSTFSSVGSLAYYLFPRFRAYVGAASYGLTRFQFPVIGPLADRWVSEE